jgi:hypothetical protein
MARENLGTTNPGFVNRNGQVVIRNTGNPGSDHLQSIYQLACSRCGHVYGANGSDIHIRRCPNCQDGKPGLPTGDSRWILAKRLRINERTELGLQRPRRAGKTLGRPRVEVDIQRLRRLQQSGLSLRKIAAKTGLSLSTAVPSLATAS